MEPGIIRKLDESVVNKIAAGEVIIRPSNALKELIENCIDAKASSIQITIRGGGIQLLQIQDNGTGIRKDDLPILCERFTTSKLKTFDDLTSIATYGFRGEALSSISQVSMLTVTTKTRDQQVAYKATYELGLLKDEPKACAGNQGTTITIENLFYNLPSRLRSITKDKSTEDKLLAEVVSKYAVHNSHIGFSLKINNAQNSIKTQPKSTQVAAIRNLYGVEIARELLEVSLDDSNLKFTCKGLISKPNFSVKKTIMLLFINNRLVMSAVVKKMIDELYSSYLERGGKPFIYLSLNVDPANVDVNIHPTKNEVCFLHEETIVAKIRAHLQQLLQGKSETKVYLSQSILPGASIPGDETLNSSQFNKSLGEKSVSYPKQVVRTDTNLQKLDKFFTQSSVSNTPVSQEMEEIDDEENREPNCTATTIKTRTKVELRSLELLKEEILENSLPEWRKIFEELVFVGHIDRGKVLIQHNTELYLCKTEALCEELFIQQVINNIENFGILHVDPALSLQKLSYIALEELEASGTQPQTTCQSLLEQSEVIAKTLVSKSQILEKFFNIHITPSGELLSLPIILEQHTPVMAYLPNFILNLALCVDWDNEKLCFDTFSKVTAKFYGKICHKMALKDWNWIVEHVLYAGLKQYLLPNQELIDAGAIMKVTSTQELYKVFERC
ncbi:DNA mismatch repair protein Mlh1 [Culicoides brevitarsis]|uniref:DNA mismatch repair protein Mlh1 n=1 Tax=Culicoides brevitarsis TaxID=469753 RepID=UPI00307B9698